MRITKNSQGQFVIEDEPLRLEGEAAEQFLSEMKRRDESGNDPERKRFLEECERIYRSTKRAPAVVVDDKVQPRGVSEEFCVALEAVGARPELVEQCRRERERLALERETSLDARRHGPDYVPSPELLRELAQGIEDARVGRVGPAESFAKYLAEDDE